jgi:hypothetical protein
MLRSASMLTLLLLSSVLHAKVCSSAKVFNDTNHNAVLDNHEQGLADIAVSDGERIVYTDKNGAYQLSAQRGKALFVIKPAGFAFPRRADGLPDWFANQPSLALGLKYGGVSQADSTCKNFALWPIKENANADLSVLVFGDPQPKSLLDVGYYQAEIVQPLLANPHAQLGISLGDIVHDDLSLHAAVKKVDKLLETPWLYAAGNHDVDIDAQSDEHSLESFRNQFGPDTFAWQETRANFIVLDDVIFLPKQKPEYIGGLRDTQFAFLEAYLAKAEKSKLLVIAMHIPLFQTRDDQDTFRRADRQRLFKLLEPFRDVLLLTAHTHSQSNVRHDAHTDWHGAGRLHEFNVGAACGAYWSGNKDSLGIPDAIMSDGTPNGYARLLVGATDYRLNWFNARQQPQQAMSLSVPKTLRQGAYPGFAVYANVFMAKANTRVSVRIDTGEWQLMNRVFQADPAVLQINARDDQTALLQNYDRIPEATASTHLFRFALPTDLAEGEHLITVRAQDEWLGSVEQTTQYTLRRVDP